MKDQEKEKLRQFNNEFLQVSDTYKFSGDCNAIMFKNAGEVPALINNALPLPPGESFTSGLNLDSLDITNYTVSFPGAAVGANKLVVIIKTNFAGEVPKVTADTRGKNKCD